MTTYPGDQPLLQWMIAIDTTWNERNWAAYGNMLDDAFEGFSGGDSARQGKAGHIQQAIEFCKIFPDNQVKTDPYELFVADPSGRSCSIARLKGTMAGPLMLGGAYFEPNYRPIALTFAVICEWKEGRILRQWEYFDMAQMLHQLQLDS